MRDTIPRWFAETARDAAPDRGIVFEERHWTFAEISRRAEVLAAWMTGRGIGRSDVMALYLSTRVEVAFAHLAAMRLGAVTLPLNTAYTGDELAYILADSAARLIVTDRRGWEVLAPIRGRLKALHEIALVEEGGAPLPAGAVALPPHPPALSHPRAPEARFPLSQWERGLGGEVGPDDVAMILYTSGTTGRPKGAQLTHRNITANLAAILQTWRITAAERFLLALPLFHAHGLILGLHGALFSGCLTFLRARFDAEEVLRELAARRCTLFMGVPTHYFRFLKSPGLARADLSAMRLFTSGSAPLDAATFAEFRARTGHAILERYGLTETLFNTGNPCDLSVGERKPGTVGLPFPGVEISIRGGEGQPLEMGEEGEIWVRGPNVFKGYLNRPEATAEALRDGWFRTGDLGRLRREDGYLEILGRAKELIITGGYNVYPAEVEAVLTALPGVDEAAVIGKPSAEYGETVHAFIVPKPGAPLDPEALLAECARHLAKYKVPRSLDLLPALPRNAMGKVQKQALREGVKAERT
jgi:malonyl-CoA/methylmalonyl-CoA synthetase